MEIKNKAIGLILLALLSGNLYQSHIIGKQNTALEASQNVQRVLNDSVHTVSTPIGVVSRKAAFTTVVDSKSKLLSKNQKQLFKAVEKTKSVQAAVVVAQVVKVVGKDTTGVAKGDTLTFTSTAEALQYHIRVVPKDTLLMLDSLSLPNTATVLVHDVASRTGKYLVVDVHNSNPYFKSADVDGYLITQKKPKLFKKILIALGVGILTGFAIHH